MGNAAFAFADGGLGPRGKMHCKLVYILDIVVHCDVRKEVIRHGYTTLRRFKWDYLEMPVASPIVIG